MCTLVGRSMFVTDNSCREKKGRRVTPRQKKQMCVTSIKTCLFVLQRRAAQTRPQLNSCSRVNDDSRCGRKAAARGWKWEVPGVEQTRVEFSRYLQKQG